MLYVAIKVESEDTEPEWNLNEIVKVWGPFESEEIAIKFADDKGDEDLKHGELSWFAIEELTAPIKEQASLKSV